MSLCMHAEGFGFESFPQHFRINNNVSVSNNKNIIIILIIVNNIS